MEDLWIQLRLRGVSEADVPTARTLEDWMIEGFVRTRREYPGRGRGSRSQYVEDTADKVVALIDLLKQYRSFDHARLILFYRGYDIGEEALKGSYVRALRGFLATLRNHLMADTMAGRMRTSGDMARSRARLRKTFPRQDPNAIIEGVASNMRNALLGQSVTEQAFGELAEAHGLPEEYWDRLSLIEQTALIDALDLDALADTVESLSMERLRLLRETMRTFAATDWSQGGLELDTATKWDELTLATVVPVPYLVALYQERPRDR